MNPNTALLLWLPLLAVLIVDHIVLKYRFRQPSAIERIVRLNGGTRLDGISLLFYYVVLPAIGEIVFWVAVPGIVLIGLSNAAQALPFRGLLGEIIPMGHLFTVVFWLLAMDFSRYVTHILLHKIPQLWDLHKIHHAAEEFNVITGNRLSIGEKFIHDIGSFVFVSFLLGVPAPCITLLVLLIWNTLNVLQHSDLPWDYGWLGYILVSPRFHRMHHSASNDDADTNFGTIFSFWDYLFGTVGKRYRETPSLADGCRLGLTNPAETANINHSWVRSFLHGTLIDSSVRLSLWCNRNIRASKGRRGDRA